MSKYKATLTDETNTVDGIFQFEIWNGYPQTPKPVIATHRRLGSRFQYVQRLGLEASISTSTAHMMNTEEFDLRQKIDSLTRRVGNYFILNYFGKRFRIILLNVEGNIRAVGGATNIIADLTLEYMVEDEVVI